MNLINEVNDAIEKAINEHSHRDEQVGYLANTTCATHPEGVAIAATVITLRMNAAVPGEYITQSFFVDTPIPTFEEVEGSIADLLMQMRQARVAHMQRIIGQLNLNSKEHSPEDCPNPDECMKTHVIA